MTEKQKKRTKTEEKQNNNVTKKAIRMTRNHRNKTLILHWGTHKGTQINAQYT